MAQITVEQANRILSEWLTKKPAEVQAQKAAMDYYGNYFKPQNLGSVTQEGFKDFLLLKNNKHWSGIHRQPQIYEDMNRLRECLAILLDESKAIEQRLDLIVPKGKPAFIPGLGRAVLTPILMCVYPEQYSVYNRISDQGLEMLGRNAIKDSDPFSKRYLSLNSACHDLSDEVRQPLYLRLAGFFLVRRFSETGWSHVAGAVQDLNRVPDPAERRAAVPELLQRHEAVNSVPNLSRRYFGLRLSGARS